VTETGSGFPVAAERRRMYEAVHAAPDGDGTVARLAATAADIGFEGVVVRSHGDVRPDYDVAAVRDAYDIDVVEGIEVRADDPEQASGFLGNYRESHTVLALHGGTTALNRFGTHQERVDVLAHPLAGDGEFDHVMARAAADRGVRVEINLGRVLRTDGGHRVQAIQDLRLLRRLVEKYDPPHVVTGDPASHLQLRAPRELLAVGETVGFSETRIREGLREWRRLAERNRERRSDAFVEPGVREGRYDSEDA
jgi:ribonuclease P/MRP protein subunit RPP1